MIAATHARDLRRNVAAKQRTASVGPEWDRRSRWVEAFRCVWRRPEHNNILECQAALQAVRYALRKGERWGMRLLLITDSLVVLGALSKGRSRARALLRLCRRTAALLLGCGV